MYTLRMISNDGTLNVMLGVQYTHIDRHGNVDAFRQKFNDILNLDHVADLDPEASEETKNIIGFVVSDSGQSIPLYRSNSYYIMADSGKTIECLNRSV